MLKKRVLTLFFNYPSAVFPLKNKLLVCSGRFNVMTFLHQWDQFP